MDVCGVLFSQILRNSFVLRKSEEEERREREGRERHEREREERERERREREEQERRERERIEKERQEIERLERERQERERQERERIERERIERERERQLSLERLRAQENERKSPARNDDSGRPTVSLFCICFIQTTVQLAKAKIEEIARNNLIHYSCYRKYP